MEFIPVIRFVHMLTVILMAAPFFALMITNERVLLGPKVIAPVDRYMETLIRKQSVRCYVFQATALVSGLALVLLRPLPFNWVIDVKIGLLFLLAALLTYVHFGIQPRVDALLARVTDDRSAEEIAKELRPIRMRRKRLSAFCLFVVLVLVILGIQVYAQFPAIVTAALIALSALFVLRAFKTTARLGWF